jgi:hypothetical protein
MIDLVTHRLQRADYLTIAEQIRAGATVEDAARKIGCTSRTLNRRMNADPWAASVISSAIAAREAARERVGHGTLTRYTHGCRCAPCREANRLYAEGVRAARRGQPIPEHVKHGTESTYRSWSCRCPACTAAHAERCRRQRQRRREGAVR